MLIQLLLILLLTSLCFGYGLIFFSKFNLKSLIFGLIILKIIVLSVNLIWPLNKIVVTTIWLAGYAFLLRHLLWRPKRVWLNLKIATRQIKKICEQQPGLRWLGLAGFILIALFSWVGSQAIPYGDAYLYHLPTVLWNQALPVVKGMALAHYRYGFISSLFELIPLTSALFENHQLYFTWTVAWWSWLVGLSTYGLAKLNSSLRNKNNKKSLSNQQVAWLWLTLALPLSLLIARTSDYVANSMPEVGLWLATVIAGYGWLKKDGEYLILAAGLGFAFKTSGLFLMLPVLFRIKAATQETRKIIIGATLLLVSLILWRSALVSGYLIFPLAITKIPGLEVYSLNQTQVQAINQAIKWQLLKQRSFLNLVRAVLLEATPPRLRKFKVFIFNLSLVGLVFSLAISLIQKNLLALIMFFSTITAWWLAPSFRLSWPYFVASWVAILLPIIKRWLVEQKNKNRLHYLSGWIVFTGFVAMIGIFRPAHLKISALILPQPSHDRAELELETSKQVPLPHTMAGEKDNNCRAAPAPCFTDPDPNVKDPAIEELKFELNDQGVLQKIKTR